MIEIAEEMSHFEAATVLVAFNQLPVRFETPDSVISLERFLVCSDIDEAIPAIGISMMEENLISALQKCRVVREGGINAGHTVVANGKKYDFHILPSGIISSKCFNVIGNGVVVNLDSFFSELEKKGITNEPGWEKRIMISDEAHIVFGVHSYAENNVKKHVILTFFMSDLMGDFEAFSEKYRQLVSHYKKQFPSITIDEKAELSKFKAQRQRLQEKNLVKPYSFLLLSIQEATNCILIMHRRVFHIEKRAYPYVTSSNATVGGACTGLGVPPTLVKYVIGVVKAYQTRVGSGPFPTELLNADGTPDKDGAALQNIGKEVGVTTGQLAIDWNRVEVEYKSFPGWQSVTTGIRNFDELPPNCRSYVKFIEDFIGVPAKWIGVGADGESLIVRK